MVWIQVSGFSANHTYTTAGIWSITLTVTDSLGQSTQQFQNIQVNAPAPPTANINASPTSGTAPLSVNMNASGSTGVGTLSYNWGFGDGDSGSGFSANHTYTTAGIWTITLTVTDSLGQSTQQFQNIQVNGPPLPQPTLTPLRSQALLLWLSA